MLPLIRHRGGQNSRGGGGQNLTRRTPTENSFRPPSPRYVPPPNAISLIKSLTNSQNFPSCDPLENSSQRVSKNGFRRAIGGKNPAAFPKVWPIFQQPFSLPENAQTLAGIAFRAAGKLVKNSPAASKFASSEFRTATAFSSFLSNSSRVFNCCATIAQRLKRLKNKGKYLATSPLWELLRCSL